MVRINMLCTVWERNSSWTGCLGRGGLGFVNALGVEDEGGLTWLLGGWWYVERGRIRTEAAVRISRPELAGAELADRILQEQN